MRIASPDARIGKVLETCARCRHTISRPLPSGALQKRGGSDVVCDGGPGERSMGIGRLRFFMAGVGSGGREKTVDVKPGRERRRALYALHVLHFDRAWRGGESTMMWRTGS